MKNWIKEAIKESTDRQDIAHTNIIGDREDLKEAIVEAWDGDYDFAEEDSDDPNERLYDVWGWTQNTPEDKQDWRIRVKLHKPEHMEKEDEKAWPGRA